MKLNARDAARHRAYWLRCRANTGDAGKRKAAPLAIAVLDAILAHLADPGPTPRGLVAAAERRR